MYIDNPTKEQLNSWYKCRKYVYDKYFIDKLPIIYCNDGFYYFVKTDDWEKIMDSMPFWLKVLEILQV